MGSVVAVRGLSCPVACGIFVPQPGVEPTSPALQRGFLTTEPPGSPFMVRSLSGIAINRDARGFQEKGHGNAANGRWLEETDRGDLDQWMLMCPS